MASPHGAGGAALFIVNYINQGLGAPTPLQVRDGLVLDGQTWGSQGGLHPEPLLDVSNYDNLP